MAGDRVEWIVERPGVNGRLATLTNYVNSAWPEGYAWNYTANTPTYYYEGEDTPAGTLELITMLDNNGKGISSATVENADSLWFRNSGRPIDSPDGTCGGAANMSQAMLGSFAAPRFRFRSGDSVSLPGSPRSVTDRNRSCSQK